jgi:ATP-dependent Clp protease ATP-binding subunit ClpC
MSAEPSLQELVEKARAGDFEPFQDLLDFLKKQGHAHPDKLLTLARSEEPILRRAALHLVSDDVPEELLNTFAGLASDGHPPVRLALAQTLERCAWWPLEHVIVELLDDSDSDVRLEAVRAARWRPALELRLVDRLTSDEYWRVRQELATVLGGFTPRAVAPVLLNVLGEDGDSDVQAACATSLEKHLATLGGYPAELPRPRFPLLKEAQARVERLRSGLCPVLSAWLRERVEVDVDLDLLKTFGSVMTLEAQAGQLPHAYEADALIDDVFKVLSGKAPRAAVVVGDSGAGKTALIYELTHRLAAHAQPWVVLRVAPADFLAGTVYLGEWETKVRNLVAAVKHPRRVLLYIPNLEELASIGMTSKSDSNVANALAPHIERGDLAIIGESTPEQFRKGLGAVRSLRRLFHAVQVPAAGPEETRDILRCVADEAGADVSDTVLDRLMDLGDFYSSGTVQPGRSVGLLRRVLGSAGTKGVLGEREILQTISTSTGIPVDFLDDTIPLDRARTRAHFEGRVMGQPEAVEAVVDLVTLVKAGLTDPGKPFGVLMFVGPTGVGKTELARALAELLFGDPARMVRLDMSEFATYEAYERLIGQGANPGLLTATVRERPFSVLLLDEIEKAHMNVYDLCLQIFDAGRLTDAQGRTADFRRTIIVLTSNVGGKITTETPVGFGRSSPPPPDTTVTMRELARFFRPEFLNRIDRIVQFRPLSAETAEKIARREVARVLERGGIARRKLVVDVGASVYPMLLREGYSPAYGARPLKRTVERLILLPVARAIASGELTAGSLVRLVARGTRVEVEVAPAESGDPAPALVPSPRTRSAVEQAEHLRRELGLLREKTAPLANRKSLLLDGLAAPGAWDDRRAAEARSDEVFRIDGLLQALQGTRERLQQIEETLQSQGLPERALADAEGQLDALQDRARLLTVLLNARDARHLGDAIVVLTRVGPQRGDLDGVGKLARMYQRLGERMGFEVVVLDDHRTTDPVEDVIVLQLTGAGAFTVVSGEQGLHYVAQSRAETTDGKRTTQREVVRVEVHAMPGSDPTFNHETVRAEVRPLQNVAGRLLERPRFDVYLSHQPTMTTLHAWTDRSRADAVGLLRPLLQARVTSAGLESAGGEVIRRYTLSPAPLVRDTRSGLSSGRLDEVLDGCLEQFLLYRAEGGEE